MDRVLIGERVYELAEASAGMVEDFADAMRWRSLERFLAQARRVGLPERLIEERGRELLAALTADTRDDAAMMAACLGTPEGMQEMLWLRVRGRGATREDVRAMPIEQLVGQMVAIVGNTETGTDRDEHGQTRTNTDGLVRGRFSTMEEANAWLKQQREQATGTGE
jgi:hypothetical protein